MRSRVELSRLCTTHCISTRERIILWRRRGWRMWLKPSGHGRFGVPISIMTDSAICFFVTGSPASSITPTCRKSLMRNWLERPIGITIETPRHVVSRISRIGISAISISRTFRRSGGSITWGCPMEPRSAISMVTGASTC